MVYIYIKKKYIYIYIYMMRPRRPKQYCLQLDIAPLWCKNQIEHSIWDESLLFCNCACSLEYSSLSTLVGLSYHICEKLEVAFKASPSSLHQHCTEDAQKAVKSLQLTRLLVECLPKDFFCQAFLDLGEIVLSSFCFLFAAVLVYSFTFLMVFCSLPFWG